MAFTSTVTFMLFLILNLFSPCLATDCYGPDGSLQNSTISYSCPTTGSATESMCCRTLDASGISGPDRCTPVGTSPGQWLCANSDGSLWRRGCSDKSWKSPGCLSICADNAPDWHGYTMSQYDEQVTPCSDGSYCCGPAAIGNACCDKGDGVWIVNGKTTKVKPANASTSTTGGAATTTVTVTPTTAVGLNAGATPVNSTSGNSSSTSTSTATRNGVIAGVVVGACVIVLTMGLGQFLYFRRLYRARVAADQAAAALAREKSEAAVKLDPYSNFMPAPRYEVAGSGPPLPPEFPGSNGGLEIGSSNSNNTYIVSPLSPLPPVPPKHY